MLSGILHPASNHDRWVSKKTEPSVSSWTHRHIPNFSDWWPGDLVLVARDRGFLGAGIVIGQAVSLKKASRMGAHWTHVGLYVGDGHMVEAVPGQGVVVSSVWKYSQYRTLFVRRLPEPFTKMHGMKVVASAMTSVGKPYSMSALVLSKLIPWTEPKPNAVYCSTFAGLAINAGSGFSLYDDPAYLPLHPSRLATHPDLINVDVEWRVPK